MSAQKLIIALEFIYLSNIDQIQIRCLIKNNHPHRLWSEFRELLSTSRGREINAQWRIGCFVTSQRHGSYNTASYHRRVKGSLEPSKLIKGWTDVSYFLQSYFYFLKEHLSRYSWPNFKSYVKSKHINYQLRTSAMCLYHCLMIVLKMMSSSVLISLPGLWSPVSLTACFTIIPVR